MMLDPITFFVDENAEMPLWIISDYSMENCANFLWIYNTNHIVYNNFLMPGQWVGVLMLEICCIDNTIWNNHESISVL